MPPEQRAAQANAAEQAKNVEIQSVAAGGKGVARVDGKVFFVADAVTGDRVDISVTSDSGRYADAKIDAFVEKSALRGKSGCPYSEKCGGCQWQDIPYAQQLEWKRQFVESALGRIGKVGAAVDVAISGSQEVLHYRNRIFVRGVFAADGRVVFGYFRRGSRDLVRIEQCAIASPVINAVLARVGSAQFTRPQELRTDTPYRMELQEVPSQDSEAGGSPQVVITVYPPSPDCRELDAFVDGLRGMPGVYWAGYASRLVDAPVLFFEEDAGIRYHTRPGQFQQVNVSHNRLVRSAVREIVESYAPVRILDLFCGSGNLSLGLCRDDRYVQGIEFSATAIATAQENVTRNNIKNALYLAGSSEKHLWKLSKKGERFDVVIADPPREGMFKELIPLANMAPRAIVYVSCDPATLSRDIGSLLKSGYRLKSVRAFDFFPNTWHVESLAVLEREV